MKKKLILIGVVLFGLWILVSAFLAWIEPKHKDENRVNEEFFKYADETERSGTNIQAIPKSDLNETKLIKNEYKEVLYDVDGELRKVVFKKSWIDYLQFSPSKNKLGFYYEHWDVPTAGRDISLVIMDIPKQSIKEVYTGSFKTSYWEWADEDHVTVYYGCGTECLYAYRINVETGRRVAGYHVYD